MPAVLDAAFSAHSKALRSLASGVEASDQTGFEATLRTCLKLWGRGGSGVQDDDYDAESGLAAIPAFVTSAEQVLVGALDYHVESWKLLEQLQALLAALLHAYSKLAARLTAQEHLRALHTLVAAPAAALFHVLNAHISLVSSQLPEQEGVQVDRSTESDGLAVEGMGTAGTTVEGVLGQLSLMLLRMRLWAEPPATAYVSRALRILGVSELCSAQVARAFKPAHSPSPLLVEAVEHYLAAPPTGFSSSVPAFFSRLLALPDTLAAARLTATGLRGPGFVPGLLNQAVTWLAATQSQPIVPGLEPRRATVVGQFVCALVNRGHAEAASRWFWQFPHDESVGASRRLKLLAASTRSRDEQLAALGMPAAARLLCEGLQTVRDVLVHQKLWEELLRVPGAVQGVIGDLGPSMHVLQGLRKLWREGTCAGLEAGQLEVLIMSLLVRRRRPLAPWESLMFLVVAEDIAFADPILPFTPSAACQHAAQGTPDCVLRFACVGTQHTRGGLAALEPAAKQVAALWANELSLTAMSEADLAANSFLLMVLLRLLQEGASEAVPGLLENVITGVSARLQHSMTNRALGLQAKRVGRVLSEVLAQGQSAATASGNEGSSGIDTNGNLDADGDLSVPSMEEGSELLFQGEGLSLLPHERWWQPPPEPPKTSQAPAPASPKHGSRAAAPLDSDPEDSDAASTASLESLDNEDPDAPLDLDDKWRPRQLHHLAEQVRQSDSSTKRVEALQALEPLVRASPAAEAQKAAPELARTLLYVTVPEWASQEYGATDAMNPHNRRLGSLVAVMCAAPVGGAPEAIRHFVSEHVDTSQRLLVLEALTAAAHELAGHPVLTPMLPPGSDSQPGNPQRPLLAGKYPQGRTRIWGVSTLRKLQQPAPEVQANQFGPVALSWTAALLEAAAGKSAGAHQLWQQPAVVGKMLTTLGEFCSCAQLTLAAEQLCAVVMDLCLDAPIARHQDVFVRVSSLVAVSHVLRTLPPARLAGAALRAASGSSPDDRKWGMRLDALKDLLEAALSAGGGIGAVGTGGASGSLATLAAGCLALQAELADSALASLDTVPVADGLCGPSMAKSQLRTPAIVLPPW